MRPFVTHHPERTACFQLNAQRFWRLFLDQQDSSPDAYAGVHVRLDNSAAENLRLLHDSVPSSEDQTSPTDALRRRHEGTSSALLKLTGRAALGIAPDRELTAKQLELVEGLADTVHSVDSDPDDVLPPSAPVMPAGHRGYSPSTLHRFNERLYNGGTTGTPDSPGDEDVRQRKRLRSEQPAIQFFPDDDIQTVTVVSNYRAAAL